MSKPKKTSRAPPQPQKKPDRSPKASNWPQKGLKMTPKKAKIKKVRKQKILQNKSYQS